MDQIKLFAGFAQGDITPPLPAANLGQFDIRICYSVKKPLMLNVAALETRRGNIQEEHSVWISADMGVSSEELQDAIAERVSRFGIDRTHVFFSCTHTHDAPFDNRNSVRNTIPGYDGELSYPAKEAPADCITPEEYFALVVDVAEKSVRKAWKGRKECSVGTAKTEANVGHCRYVVLDNKSTGKRETHMYGYARSRAATETTPEYEFIGFTDADGDDTVETLGFWDTNNELIGIVAGIHCPAQTSEHDRFISSDMWGYAREKLSALTGKSVPLVALCMFAGDIVPFDPFIPAEQRRPLTESVAERIAVAIANGLKIAKDHKNPSPLLFHERIPLDVPLFPVTHEAYKDALETLKGETDKFSRFYALGVKERYERMNFRYEMTQELLLHVVRLGDAAIGTAPFEMYLSYGLDLRNRLSKYKHVLPVQLTGGPYGYLPNPDSIENPSYGVGASSGITGPEGGFMIVDTLAGALEKMKA